MLKKVEKQIQAHALAAAFMSFLYHAIGPKKFILACVRNVDIADGLCASHDFCDANIVMAAAFEHVLGREPQANRSHDAIMWSEAWEIATKAMAAIGRVQ